MNKLVIIALFFLTISCQVTETITINPDGSGSIVLEKVRDENFFHKLNSMSKNPEDEKEVFKDSAYVFGDLITKHAKTFNVIPVKDQAVFLKYKDVKIHIIQDSYNKKFSNTLTQKFNSVADIVDLDKTQRYASDVINNYALAAEKDYYQVSYSFDNKVFKRKIEITNLDNLKEEIETVNYYLEQMKQYNAIDKFTLNYHFPKMIKSISNPNAIISADKKSFVLEFKLSECMKNPKMTEIEVELEE